MLGIGSVDVRVERSVDALCALSEWVGRISNNFGAREGEGSVRK